MSATNTCPGCSRKFAPRGFSNHLRLSHDPRCASAWDRLQPTYSDTLRQIPPRTSHWGQKPVFQVGTLQIHWKEMDRVLEVYPPRISKVYSEFSQLISLQCFSWGNSQHIHSVPSHVTVVFPSGKCWEHWK